MAQQQPAPFPDTAHFLDAANDSARNFRAVYVTYLIIAFYILVIISSTDDELLFRAGNVQMPIINTSVPVRWFFTVAPWILFLLHLNLLMQAVFLSTKVHLYISRLSKEKTHVRGLLFPAPLAQLLAAGGQQRSVQWILQGVVLISLVLLSPGILIYAEIQFLTYQSEPITWMHRTAILLDIILLWCLWPRIITPPNTGWKEWWRKSPLKCSVATILALIATGLLVIVLVIADIPGGTMENFILPNALRDWRERLDHKYQLASRTLVQEEPPPEILATYLATCKSQNPDDQPDCQDEIEPGSPIWCQHAKPLPLQGRAFRHANLRGAILCGANLRSAELQGADLSSAKLQGANLRSAELQGAFLTGAELQGANLSSAKLQGAFLTGAELQGADLRLAKLQGASLSFAELQGADLSYAQLQGASLSYAKLQGAFLTGAELQGASLTRTELQGADLRLAKLQGADLSYAQLQGASLSYAKLQGAFLTGAELQGAFLTRTELQGASLTRTELQGADLRLAQLQGASLSLAKLQGADLRSATLQGADLRGTYLAGSDISDANLNLADLRDVDLESKPSQEQLQKTIAIIDSIKQQERQTIAIIDSIKQQERRDRALKSVKRAETEEATIAPSSIEDAIFSKDSALYRQLQESENRELLQAHHFTQTKEEDYDTKLAAYLIDPLSCEDEDNYVAEGIIRHRILEVENRKLSSIFAEKLNLDSKVPSLLCQGVEKHLNRLSEREHTQLRILHERRAVETDR